MSAAFRGLQFLTPLNVNQYRKCGNLDGLTTLLLEAQIREAERISRVDFSVIVLLLSKLVDPFNTAKTKPSSEVHLFDLHSNKGNSPESALKIALCSLAEQEVVRTRRNLDSDSPTWVLNHDYLCTGVLELTRRQKRWHALLIEAYSAFASTTRLAAKWKALLRPSLQCRLYYEFLRGRLVYGPSRKFAVASIVKMLVNIPVVALLLFIASYQYLAFQRDRSTAEHIFSEFGLDASEGLTESERSQLWNLSRSNERVRQDVFSVALESPGSVKRLLRRLPLITHSAIGLNPSRKDALVRALLPRCLNAAHESGESDVFAACVSLLRSVSPRSDVLQTLLTGISDTYWVERTILEFRDGLDSATADQLADTFTEKLSSLHSKGTSAADENISPDDTRWLLSRSIGNLGPRLSQSYADNLAALVITAVKQRIDSGLLVTKLQMLREIGDTLSVGQQDNVVATLSEAIKLKWPIPDPRFEMLTILASLSLRLGTEQADATVGILNLHFANYSDRDRWVQVASAIAPHLSSKNAVIVDSLLWETVSGDVTQLTHSSKLLEQLASRLPEDYIRSRTVGMNTRLRASILDESEGAFVAAVVPSLLLWPRLPVSTQDEVVKMLVAELSGNEHSTEDRRERLIWLLTAVSSKLSPGGTAALGTLFKVRTVRDDVGDLSRAQIDLIKLGAKVSKEYGVEVRSRIIEKLRKADDIPQVISVLKLFCVTQRCDSPIRISADDASTIAKVLFKSAVLSDNSVRSYESLIEEFLEKVGLDLNLSSVEELGKAALVGASTNPRYVSVLKAFAILGQKIPSPLADAIMGVLVAEATKNPASRSGVEAAVLRLRTSMSPAARAITAKQLLGWIPVKFDKGLADSLTALQIPTDVDVEKTLNELLPRLRRGPLSTCLLVRPFIDDRTLPSIIEVLKWPTCIEEDRKEIIEEIGHRFGIDFALGKEPMFSGVWLRFFDWCRKRHLDIDGVLRDSKDLNVPSWQL